MRSADTDKASDTLLVTVVEAAAVLAVGRTTVYELINAGALRAVHIGRCVRIPVAELERFVEAIRHGGDAATSSLSEVS